MANPLPSWQYLESNVERFKQELRKIRGEEELSALTETSAHPLLKAYNTLRRSLEQLPGAFLLSEVGAVAWKRLLNYSRPDPLTAAHLVKQLSTLLSKKNPPREGITFLDDARWIKLFDGREFPLKTNPLGYVAFRIIYEQGGGYVTWDKILHEIVSCDESRLCPRLTDDVLGHIKKTTSRRTLQRAIKALPPSLRKYFHPHKKGRYFSWTS
jgi:hypothetical protein